MSEKGPKETSISLVGDTTQDKYQCAICMDILREPHLTECCGQHYCGECLKKSSKHGSTCPHCRKYSFNHILDKHFKREIDELKVYCPKKRIGCPWEGELGNQSDHLKSKCLYVEVECTQCKQKVKRLYLEKHVSETCSYRIIKCLNCGVEGTCFNITTSHPSVCPNHIVSCPNICGADRIKRISLDLHLKVCPNQIVDCPFRDVGCTSLFLMRKDFNDHTASSIQSHMMHLVTAFNSSQKQVQVLTQKVCNLEIFKAVTEAAVHNVQSTIGDMEEKATSSLVKPLTSIQKDLQSLTNCHLSSEKPQITLIIPNFKTSDQLSCYSRPFFLNSGYRLRLKMTKCSDGVRVSSLHQPTTVTVTFALLLLKGNFDKNLTWPMSPSILNFELKLLGLCISVAKEGIRKCPYQPIKDSEEPFILWKHSIKGYVIPVYHFLSNGDIRVEVTKVISNIPSTDDSLTTALMKLGTTMKLGAAQSPIPSQSRTLAKIHKRISSTINQPDSTQVGKFGHQNLPPIPVTIPITSRHAVMSPSIAQSGQGGGFSFQLGDRNPGSPFIFGNPTTSIQSGSIRTPSLLSTSTTSVQSGVSHTPLLPSASTTSVQSDSIYTPSLLNTTTTRVQSDIVCSTITASKESHSIWSPPLFNFGSSPSTVKSTQGATLLSSSTHPSGQSGSSQSPLVYSTTSGLSASSISTQPIGQSTDNAESMAGKMPSGY